MKNTTLSKEVPNFCPIHSKMTDSPPVQTRKALSIGSIQTEEVAQAIATFTNRSRAISTSTGRMEEFDSPFGEMICYAPEK